MKKIASRSSVNLTKTAFKKRFHDTALPVVVRNMPGYGDAEHSFEKFMDFYHANKADLEQDACEFKINGGVNDSITSLAEVLESWDHYKPDGNILGWLVLYGQIVLLQLSVSDDLLVCATSNTPNSNLGANNIIN